MKHILFFIVFVVTSVVANAQVIIDQHVDSMQVLIGEQTKFTLSATIDNGQNVKFPEFSKNQYITPGLEILQSLKADTVEVGTNRLKISKSYVLISFDEKVYYIPSQKIIVGNRTYNSKALALKVLTIPVDTVHIDKFYPPKDVQDNPFSWAEWSSVFVFSILFVILLAMFVYLYYRLKHNRPIVSAVRIIKRIPPHQKAIKGIELLKREQISLKEDQKEYYTRLTEILRQYIAERFHFDAMEMTSSEIIGRLKSEGNEAINEISNLFHTADLVKFAKHSALINENDANLVNALAFVNDTKTDEKTQLQVVTPEVKKHKEEKNRRLVQKIIVYAVAFLAVASLCAVVYRVYVLI